MGRFAAAFVATSFGLVHQAHAFCTTPGEVRACFVNGKEGTQTCGENNQFGPCEVEPDPPPPPPPSGPVTPKYKVLAVVYAPPGKTGGGSTSSVSYGTGSSVGTTTAGSHGFKSGETVTASASGGILSDGSVSASFGYSRNTVDSSALDIRKTASTTLTQTGPAADGIDHDRDQIWLWLGPQLQVTLTSATSLEWGVDPSAVKDLQFVFVGHLKNPSLMPPGVQARLTSHGITAADYPNILQVDPFAFGSVPINASRYVQLNTTFPYEPPFAPGEQSPTFSSAVTYATTSTSTSSVANEYNVNVAVGGDANFASLFKASLKSSSTWTWTDTNSRTNVVGSTESAAVAVGGPSFGYAGPTDVAVYYDLLYKTFMFAFVDAPAMTGVVLSKSGRSVEGKAVDAVVDGVVHRTFTNAEGEFRIFDVKPGLMALRVDGRDTLWASSSLPPVIEVP